MPLIRHLARGSIATFGFALAALVACSGSDRSNGVGGEGFTPPAAQGGPCTPGQKRECGIELGRTGSLVDCAKGEQTCGADKTWGACVTDSTRFKAAAPSPSKGGPAPDLGTNAVGGTATTCADNPCNPYCKSFDDVPDSGITTDAVTITTPGDTITLDKSNVPPGFQNKGTLDSQCAGSKTSQAYLEACQFDMKCGTKPDGSSGCIPFPAGASDGCAAFSSGSMVDITAPVVCVPKDTSVYRNVTVCNRGSDKLTDNIQCMSFPGNSPHFPDANPGAGIVVLQTATTADAVTGTTNPITAAKPLGPGECRTYRVPNSVFQSNGTESIMCNPPSTAAPVTTTLDTFPASVTTTDFKNPDLARVQGDANASATVSFETAALTGQYAGAQTSNTGFTNPANALGATNSSSATATATTVTTSSVSASSVVSNACTDTGCTWVAGGTSIVSDLSTNNGTSASASIPKNSSSTLIVDGFSFPSLPASSIITGVTVTLDWSTGSRTSGTAVLKKSDGTILGSVSIGTSTTSNATTVIPIAYGDLWEWELSGLRLELTASRGNAGAGTDPLSVDHAALAVQYSPYNFASIELNTFGSFGTTPAGGTIMGVEILPTWTLNQASSDGAMLVILTRSDGSYLGHQVFYVPTGYTAGSAITVPLTASVGSVTDAELAGVRAFIGLYRWGGSSPFTVTLDSLRLRPLYRTNAQFPRIVFGNFGVTVPTGATNVKLTTYANWKIDPRGSEDYIFARAWSGTLDKSSYAVLSSGGAQPANNAFNVYQLGAATIADPTTITDDKLFVEFYGYKSGSIPVGTSTGSLDYLTLRLQYDATVGASVAECNPHNNWSVNKANPPTVCEPSSSTTYPPWTVSRVFDGACPVGTIARWKYMGYTSTTPTGTKIEFRLRAFDRDSTGACPTLAPVTSGTSPAPLATAQLSPDTQVCSLTAAPTASCPVNLTTGLGNVDSRKPCLQMDAYGAPATTPPSAPTLTDWRVTYDCIPEE